MASLREGYESEVKRMHETYGPGAEGPHDPYAGSLRVPIGATATVPVEPPSQRIAQLAQQCAEAGHMLAEAREDA
jgi:hypothetical protein